MTTRNLAELPESWRPALIDLERALAPVVRRPRRFDMAAERWAADEPPLGGLTAAGTFAEPGALTEAQARALIRVSRTDDPDAEWAGWALIWQFAPGVMSIVRHEARVGGSEGGRAAACTAVAELWRQIQRIDLDTNRASIFYALLARARRAVVPSVHGITAADRLVWSLVDPAELSGHDDETTSTGRAAGEGRSSNPNGPIRVLRQLWDAAADGSDQAIEEAEWGATLATLGGDLADRLTADLVADLGWNRDHAQFPRRQARLRAYVQQRIAGAELGHAPTAAEIANGIDAPFQSVRDLHKSVNRVLRGDAGRYRRTVLASIDPSQAAAA